MMPTISVRELESRTARDAPSVDRSQDVDQTYREQCDTCLPDYHQATNSINPIE